MSPPFNQEGQKSFQQRHMKSLLSDSTLKIHREKKTLVYLSIPGLRGESGLIPQKLKKYEEWSRDDGHSLPLSTVSQGFAALKPAATLKTKSTETVLLKSIPETILCQKQSARASAYSVPWKTYIEKYSGSYNFKIIVTILFFLHCRDRPRVGFTRRSL